jgi:asparagine synthetase B (glutamine-hydrolysing)
LCGICGELRFDGAASDMAATLRMSATLARRGPDHAGTFADGPLAFGHRRLAIIDLSPSADQPMVDPALQLALVFNGTIYNYRELPDAVIDRPKGYFPVPALKHVRGPFLELMRGILQSDACIRRGLYQRGFVAKLLANPEAHFTRIQGSKLWHLALLEWWLQVHVDGVMSGADAASV